MRRESLLGAKEKDGVSHTSTLAELSDDSGWESHGVPAGGTGQLHKLDTAAGALSLSLSLSIYIYLYISIYIYIYIYTYIYLYI